MLFLISYYKYWKGIVGKTYEQRGFLFLSAIFKMLLNI